METLVTDSNGGVSRQKFFGERRGSFFSAKCMGGKIKN
jgi:hypothetical protein